jgi:hypothetical protein
MVPKFNLLIYRIQPHHWMHFNKTTARNHRHVSISGTSCHFHNACGWSSLASPQDRSTEATAQAATELLNCAATHPRSDMQLEIAVGQVDITV